MKRIFCVVLSGFEIIFFLLCFTGCVNEANYSVNPPQDGTSQDSSVKDDSKTNAKEKTSSTPAAGTRKTLLI